MIRIGIVEDESHYRDQLIAYLRQFEQERGEKVDIVTFLDGDEIVENYSSQFDIILMDIQMKFMDGMTAAEEIRKLDSKVVIIFITSMAQYAIKGYEVDALDYVLKPISYFQFSQRLNRALERMKKREDRFITVAVKEGIKRLKVSDLYYVESRGHILEFHSKHGEFTTVGTMKELEEMFSNLHFFRANNGYLINLEHVEGVNDSCAIVNEQNLLISRRKKKLFMEALSNYWGEVIK